jgi:hypothetical protein
MAGRKATISVLDQVEELDQKVATPLTGAQKRTNIRKRNIIKATTLRTTIAAAAILNCHALSP